MSALDKLDQISLKDAFKGEDAMNLFAAIADCEARESRLNDWERTFLDSVKSKLTRDEYLTAEQESKLWQIWDKATEEG